MPVLLAPLAEVALGRRDLLVGLHLRARRLGGGFLVGLGDLLVGLGLRRVGLLLLVGGLVAAAESERERHQRGRENRSSNHEITPWRDLRIDARRAMPVPPAGILRAGARA